MSDIFMQKAERLYGLIGYPLSHSFSKRYFTEKFEKENIAGCRYELFPIKSVNDLRNIIHNNPTLCGLNVTIPYKETVIPFLHNMTDAVHQIGACNCIQIFDGKLTGYNTDVIGFEKMILPYLKPYHSKALILGTGGAAKAVAWVFNKLGLEYIYVSRDAGMNKISYSDIDASLMDAHKIVVNTTPLGMAPNTEGVPEIPFDYISSEHLFIDLIYNPAKTRFLSIAEQKGATIVNGMEMLIIQAEEAWKIWNQ
jgi:shikimate dehydrogenase